MRYRIAVSLAAVVLVHCCSSVGLAGTITYNLENLVLVDESSGTHNGPGFVQSNSSLFHQTFFEVSTAWHTNVAVDVTDLDDATIVSAALNFKLLTHPGSGPAETTSFVSDGVLGGFFDPASPLGTPLPFTMAVDNSVDVTSLLQERIDSDAQWFGLNLAGSGGIGYTRTLSNPDAAEVRLVVEFTTIPEPSTLVLAGIAALGLLVVGTSRFRRAQARRVVAGLFLFCLISVFASRASHAAPITVPTDLLPGDSYRLAFVTSTTRNAASTDIADYNTFVTAVANGVTELADLGTTWKAIGSTATVDARDNTGTNPTVSTGVPIYRVDDMRIANDNADLWDSVIFAPISIDESGGLLDPATTVWTGTHRTGVEEIQGGLPPISRALGSSWNPVSGIVSAINNGWVETGGLSTGTDLRPLYAMSGVLTVVPEPGSMTLVCIGATAVAACLLRRRRHRKT